MKRTIHLDLKKSELKGLGIDEKITVQVTGKIRNIRASEEMSKEEKKQRKDDGTLYDVLELGSIGLTIDELKIKADDGNEFTELAEDE